MSKTNGSFTGLVREAAAVKKELEALSALGGQKLSPAGYLSEAMHIASIDSARLKKLRSQTEHATSQGMLDIAGALRRMVRAARSANFPTPPKTARPLRHMLASDTTAELAKLGATPLDLFALAALIATEKHPEDFGPAGAAQSSEAYNARLLELTIKTEQLEARIASEFTPADLLFDDDRASVSFKVSKGTVALAPRANCAKRLVNWVLANEAKVMA